MCIGGAPDGRELRRYPVDSWIKPLKLTHAYAQLPADFYACVEPEAAPEPTLLAWNAPLAAFLGMQAPTDDPALLAAWFSGNVRLPGSRPIAMAYAGHQFGHFVAQLGDGRAHLLGEAVSPVDGRQYDVQLKGSGRTPYSRNGDGKAALGPVIREYLVSEAMHRLRAPTTRSLAMVATGEPVYRESPQPGAVLTRIAASHIRVGTFQFFAARGDLAALRALLDFAIARHYPDCARADKPARALFAEVVGAQARLVAHWLSVGFIHGVMNTDNCAISGETIDYGPCAFMDGFDVNQSFSAIDHQGRYRYGNQASMAQWNLARLASCLQLLDDEPAAYEAALARFAPQFEAQFYGLMRDKLGLSEAASDDAALVTAWLQHLQDHSLDFTLSFRRLAARVGCHDAPAFGEFELRWRARIEHQPGGAARAAQLMASANPVYIPRNHQVQRAIDAALRGDWSVFRRLRAVLDAPFEARPEWAEYQRPPRPAERVTQTFCGT